MEKKKIVYVNKDYEIKSKKPKTAVFIDSTQSLRRYNLGAKKIVVPKTGVVLRRSK